ncbi:MAG: hypothetical protein ACE5D3_00015 [Candidatus Binatia bacterium]
MGPQGNYAGLGIDPMLSFSMGSVAGVSCVNKFGYNADVDTTTLPEDVWDAGGVHVPPTTARVHALVSTSAADAAAGTGARTIKVTGLLADWTESSETVTLNGLTPVNTVQSYTRIYRMKTLTAGSGGVNAGTITATAAIDSTVTAQISIGFGQTLMAIYSVPTGNTAYMTSMRASLHRSGAPAGAMAEISLYERTGIDGASPALRARHIVGASVTGTGHATVDTAPYRTFVGPCDVFLRVTESSDNNVGVTGSFDMILVNS